MTIPGDPFSDNSAMERLMSSLPHTKAGHLVALQNQLTAARVVMSYAAKTIQSMSPDDLAACAHDVGAIQDDATELLEHVLRRRVDMPPKQRRVFWRMDACDN